MSLEIRPPSRRASLLFISQGNRIGDIRERARERKGKWRGKVERALHDPTVRGLSVAQLVRSPGELAAGRGFDLWESQPACLTGY